MTIHLLDHRAKPGTIARSTIRSRAARLLAALGLKDRELSLVLCEDDEIKELNKAWRKKDKATDVLSFPQDDEQILGDVVLSIETAARQSADEDGWARAHARGGAPGHTWTPLDEATLLLIHGVLHLLGTRPPQERRGEVDARRGGALVRALDPARHGRSVGCGGHREEDQHQGQATRGDVEKRRGSHQEERGSEDDQRDKEKSRHDNKPTHDPKAITTKDTDINATENHYAKTTKPIATNITINLEFFIYTCSYKMRLAYDSHHGT